MALFRHVPTQMIEDLNRLNDSVATTADVTFTDVRPATPDEIALKGKDSFCRARGISHKYYGTRPIYYNRLKLQSAFANQLIKLTFLKPFTSLYDQFDVLNQEFSSVFTKDDLEDFIPEDPNALIGVMKMTAKPESLGWIGEAQIAYELIDPIIVEIPDTNLDGIMTPNERVDVSQASLLYTAYDFKVDSTWLEGLPVQVLGADDITRLRDALLAKRPDLDWAESGAAPYSLEGVELVYIGQQKDYIINKLYKQVAVFKLGTTSTGVAGHLFLHYSKEGDENV